MALYIIYMYLHVYIVDIYFNREGEGVSYMYMAY